MRKIYIIVFVFAAFLQGTVEVGVTVVNVPIGGVHLAGGSLSFNVFDNDFPDASPENPVYLQFRYFKNIRLSDTLVDPESEDPILAAPIFLPLISDNSMGIEVVAPADAVSIVDWRAGHRDIWLKIQRSSENWIKMDGLPTTPSQGRHIRFFLGIPAWFMLSVESSSKSLPFPTRNSGLAPDLVDLAESVDTTLCIDLSGIFSSENFITDFDVFAYGSGAKTEEGKFKPTTPYPVDITGSFFNGVAAPDGCNFEVSSTYPDILPVTTDPQDWRTYSRQINFRGGCDSSPWGRSSTLKPGSGLELTILGDGYGFGEDGIEFDQALPVRLILSEPFSLRERTLFRTARLEWLESSTMPEQLMVTLNVVEDLLGNRSDLVARWHFDLMDPAEVPLCNLGLSPLGRGTIHLVKQATEVAKARLIPHLTRSNGGFSTHLILSNASFYSEYVQLTSYSPFGQVLTSVSVEVPPQQTFEYEVSALLGAGDHAWLSVPAEGLLPVTAVYRANGPHSTPAAVPTTDLAATAFRIFPGDGINTWDGLALVNENEAPVSIQIQQKNSIGEILAIHSLGEHGRGKILYVLEADFTYVENTYFDIIASKAIYVTALRGDRNSTFLWTIPVFKITD